MVGKIENRTKRSAMIGLVLTGLLSFPSLAQESDSDSTAIQSKIPIEVTLNKVREGDVPLYISIQNKSEYQTLEGGGGILQSTHAGQITRTFDVPKSGDYAVSVWHDLDNDGEFSMADNFQLLDGWGTSGEVPFGTPPTFDAAKVSVPVSGAKVEIEMIYP